MHTLVHTLAPALWAEHNFSGADCGDERRTRRLLKVAARAAEHPRGRLSETFQVHSELDAAYRLFDADDVTHDAVLARHRANTRAAFVPGRRYIVAEDTTTLDYSHHKALEDTGRIGDDGGRGFFVHSSLAFELVNGQPEMIGLYDQHVWARGDDFRCEGRSKAERLRRPRESQRWGQLQKLPVGVDATFIADREADIYECLSGCAESGWHYVIRACQNRATVGQEPARLFASVAGAPVLGEIELHLRSRPGQGGPHRNT